ncbi:MAG: signal peptide peptidase SppA [Chitinophagaceae bacterium]
MRSFIKIFFASFLALVIFSVIAFFILALIVGSAIQPSKPDIGSKAVLVLDLSTDFKEQAQSNPLSSISGDPSSDQPGLYDIVRMIHYAKSDSSIKGIYIKADDNANGFGNSEELRQALIDFKQSKKFVIAYGEVITQKAYYVANVADKIYCHPTGGIEWNGFSSDLFFIKNLLDKLQIQPQIFYAGKFKSATEPLRVTKMTDANRLQTTVWLGDLYNNFLLQVSKARNIDTATLHQLAINGSIQTANDALKNNLVDGLKYDDEIKSEILNRLSLKQKDEINFVSFGKYAKAVDFKNSNGKDKIAIIYAQGDIVGGKGEDGEIGSDNFKNIIRKARLDDNIKAIVFRVNSPGGSSLASDVIWREISLAKQSKPVVVSMGNVAASGGYFISCNADSIFADAQTITGSIGVFSIIPNMQSFFQNKLGITFDAVKTAPYADLGTASRPLTETEKRFLQASVDSIYYTFKSRVANGRKKNIVFIDSIAQGRVWTGQRALGNGLIDRIGSLQDAVACAARMAKTNNYRTTEYPEPKSLLEQILNTASNKSIKENSIKKEIGEQQYNLFNQLKSVQQMLGTPQARLPFNVDIR